MRKQHIQEVTHRWLEPASGSQTASSEDALAIDGIDHLELYVGNAKQAAFFYTHALGFSLVAYRGPETGYRASASYVLQQGCAKIVISAPLRAVDPLHAPINRHSDHVHSIALTVPDCQRAYYEALKRGAFSACPPYQITDSFGTVRIAEIGTYGEVTHPLVERVNYTGSFMPGYLNAAEIFPLMSTPSIGISAIDHIVGNVELGKMDFWVSYYERVLGFTEMLAFSKEQISTEYSALMSKVMRNGSGKVKFPINEPAHGKRKSQIDEYLEFNYGPGVQHIALRTDDIISTVTAMRARGVQFLSIPHSYYEALPGRIGKIKEDVAALGALGILADRDDDGYLLQIFTKPIQDRPTLFFEVIQREGSERFGEGNFKALFEAIEREQDLRGNL